MHLKWIDIVKFPVKKLPQLRLTLAGNILAMAVLSNFIICTNVEGMKCNSVVLFCIYLITYDVIQFSYIAYIFLSY